MRKLFFIRSLIDLLETFEKPFAKKEGSESLAGSYEGISPDILYANLTNSKGNENPEEGKSAILDCQCGMIGCWTFLVKTIEKKDTIVWTAFEQIHRSLDAINHWDYSNLNDFVFDKKAYFEKLDELKNISNG